MLIGLPPSSRLHGVSPSMNPHTYLSFDLLEDVMLLPSSKYEEIVERSTILRIGPLVEYAYHHYEDAANHLRSRSDLLAVNSLLNVMAGRTRVASDTWMKARPVEFFRIPQSPEEVNDPNWIAFCMRLTDAGVKAGLPKQFSQGLAGTFEEMTGNLLEHSERSASGVAGYMWRAGEFEYVVADAGIGVLNSLHQHSDYSLIADSGEALETAVCDGESRHGRKDHRGTGFHDLITNIARRNSYLRFRSGDHSYSLDGTKSLPVKQVQHCAPFQGFLISVVSRPLNRDFIRGA
jgi:hypothetical protein